MKISPLVKAQEHLEEAIVQYLDKKKFLLTITLAGVAEEILGKTLPKNQMNSHDWLKNSFNKPLKGEDCLVAGNFKGDGIITVKFLSEISSDEIGKCLNMAKNSIKHDIDAVEIDSKAEAEILLQRALDNYFSHNLKVTPNIARIVQHFLPHLKYDCQQEGFAFVK